MHRTRSYSGIRGGVVILRNLKKRLTSWLEDENPCVRDFAPRVMRRLDDRIESEQKWTAEEEIKRKKGLL